MAENYASGNIRIFFIAAGFGAFVAAISGISRNLCNLT
jgi:hypothetical protein